MSLLIDGYNLLHVTGIFGQDRGSASFRQSRDALLDFLASAVDPKELSRTTVVFDASEAPPGLPRILKHSGLTVLFAAEYDCADALLEELIRADSAPGKLTVVSSDHRVQRAAKRRKATAIDSHDWYRDLKRAHQLRETSPTAVDTKPEGPLSELETKWWLAQFPALDPDLGPSLEGNPRKAGPPQTRTPRSASRQAIRHDQESKKAPAKKSAKKSTKKEKPAVPGLSNPFPLEYLEQVKRETQDP